MQRLPLFDIFMFFGQNIGKVTFTEMLLQEREEGRQRPYTPVNVRALYGRHELNKKNARTYGTGGIF